MDGLEAWDVVSFGLSLKARSETRVEKDILRTQDERRADGDLV